VSSTNTTEEQTLLCGIDVGSTTAKVVVTDGYRLIWHDYRRHNSRQMETVQQALALLAQEMPGELRVFTTGSGGRVLGQVLGATYLQEVNAVSYAIESRYPRARSAIELGGQDAKVVIRASDAQGRTSLVTLMNDKCAGGTGATIDRVFSRFGLTAEELGDVTVAGRTVHNISAKCGVFAETDVVGLLKTGADPADVWVSLCMAVARQNLEVLVRGHVLPDQVLLLGGPHVFFKNVFSEVWRELIPQSWRSHDWQPQTDEPLERLIFVPPEAEYFAALGAAMWGAEMERSVGGKVQGSNSPHGAAMLVDVLHQWRRQHRRNLVRRAADYRGGLVESEEETDRLKNSYAVAAPVSPMLRRGDSVVAALGIDGGSTSSKLALLDDQNRVLYSDYLLSQGNPIAEMREMFQRLDRWREAQAAKIDVTVAGATGYAAPILREAFRLDSYVVETVAHLKSARAYCGDIDVICDVGGQDIKVLFLRNGRVTHFKLNTQCSAGNGYFLQGMAAHFGLSVDQYAEAAFRARRSPPFNCGCAVFMDQDKVNFQQQGWTHEEIMAGLALALPSNIWQYVVQEANLSKLGRTFLLQGGTQRNLAAVKAQVDYIKAKVPGAEVKVHPYADLCGAIGAALHARQEGDAGQSRFVGLERAAAVTFETKTDDTTRCRFCTNRCPRTFVDIHVAPGKDVRFISGQRCEQGSVDDVQVLRDRRRERRAMRGVVPNLVEAAAREAFADFSCDEAPRQGRLLPPEVSSILAPSSRTGRLLSRVQRFQGPRAAVRARRAEMTIGLPRVLNLYCYAPFFNAYFRALGVGRVIYSEFTSNDLWQRGNKWGSIDPCFPAKVAPAHVFDLLERPEITHVCFPMVTHLPSMLPNTLGHTACAIQMGTPEVVEAAFTRQRNLFREAGVEYWKPLLRLDQPRDAAGSLFDYFGHRLSMTEHENAWAVTQGFKAMGRYGEGLQRAGTETLNWLVDQDRMGVVLLGHPYHHDPGLNHGIAEQIRLLGFPVFSIESLPSTPEFLAPLFEDEASESGMERGLDIRGVWRRNFNRNTNHKVWAAQVAARHPHLAVVDLSSFKCGHDAPTYSYVDALLGTAGTPHFLFHDLDQNKPTATHNIRLQTVEYFLRQSQAELREEIKKRTSNESTGFSRHGTSAAAAEIRPTASVDRLRQ
jgi:predicted CoA-substrate-specific enzyme activase